MEYVKCCEKDIAVAQQDYKYFKGGDKNGFKELDHSKNLQKLLWESTVEFKVSFHFVVNNVRCNYISLGKQPQADRD